MANQDRVKLRVYTDSNTVDLEFLAETINAVELVEVKGL